MKIHMDYLENKLEICQSQLQQLEKDKSKMARQLETAQDKLSLIKDSKDREIKDLNRKLENVTSKLSNQVQKTQEAERKLTAERENFNQKVRSINNSALEHKSTEQSVIHSSKSKQKN